jgi:hypothetical protein
MAWMAVGEDESIVMWAICGVAGSVQVLSAWAIPEAKAAMSASNSDADSPSQRTEPESSFWLR